MSISILKTRNLSKTYQTNSISTKAIKNISIDVEEGEFIAIMGPSGCGKSTLLNILGMLDRPSSGEYYLMGKNVSNLTEPKRTGIRKGNIAFVFQSFNLIDDLTVYQNVELPLMYLKKSEKERKTMVNQILEKTQLSDLKQRFPYQISGGQQQRVAIARAIIFEPKIILADEPTGNLDYISSQNIMNILSDLNKEGKTIILVTHEESSAKFCNRIIHILDGYNVIRN